MRRVLSVVGVLGLALAIAKPAGASLTTFTSFVGKVGVSTDGFGSTTQAGNIEASVPVGSTVLGAYLYTSTFFNAAQTVPVGNTLAGSPVVYGPSLGLTAPCCSLAAFRADVTSIVKPIIDGGPGGVYSFAMVETAFAQDGEALVVVYSNPALADASVGILDGFSAVGGDNTSINFADPLHPADAGFFAEMMLGIGFSCCNQASRVDVNGTTITLQAGNNDDGAAAANGSLITVGSFDDPFSPLLPTYAQDHERYNIAPFITDGDTSISIFTQNPSADDNIFLAVFHTSGIAGFNEPPPDTEPPSGVPEPSTMILLGTGLAGIIGKKLRQRRA
jgi:hypothetical protein